MSVAKPPPKKWCFNWRSTMLTKICRGWSFPSAGPSAGPSASPSAGPSASRPAGRPVGRSAPDSERELSRFMAPGPIASSRSTPIKLAGRHFGDSAGEYTIAVTKRGHADQIIYRSDAGVSETALAGGDVTAGFFKILLEETNSLYFAQLRHPDMNALAQLKPQLNRQRIIILDAGALKSEKGAGDAVLQRLPLGIGAEGVTRTPLNRANEGGWRLVVKHRAGSLEAAVTATRRRNLAISFGILSLLGVSVGFIVLSSRRAQRLATQQMEFVAGVSHELRTPLAVICSAAENLADGVIDSRDQIKR